MQQENIKTMNKRTLVYILIIAALIVIGLTGWRLYGNQNQNIPVSQTTNIPKNIPATKTPELNDFTATFEIFTNGTRRIFTAAMYHNQSQEVFIQTPDPSIIYVKKDGITWASFFKTLPFSLDETCLVTGNKERYCSNEEKKLRFFLNDFETPNALDLKIKPGDVLRITYGN